MGRAEMQMLRTGDLAGGGGERRALNLFPHTHTLGNVLGPPVAWRKLSPRQAGNRYRAQAVGDSGPPELPRCSGLHPAPAAGKVAPAAVQTVSGQGSRSSGVSISGSQRLQGPLHLEMPSSPCPLAWAQMSPGTHGTVIPCAPSPASPDCPTLGVPHCDPGTLKSQVEPHLLKLSVGVSVLSCPCSHPVTPWWLCP